MAKRYAKVLEDGTIDIAGSVVKHGSQTFYHPIERTLNALGYFELIEVPEEEFQKEGYKVIDQGYRVEVNSKGDKIVTNAKRYLQIVDNPPKLSKGLYIRNDYWKEIGDKWVHVYDVASSKRHGKHKHEDKPDAVITDDDQSASSYEEQIAAAESTVEAPVEETVEAPVDVTTESEEQ